MMDSIEKGRKRRYSEDEEMDEASTDQLFVAKNQQPQQSYQHTQYDWKRNKTGLAKKTKLERKLGMMDKEKLLQVLASLMDKQPELKHDIMTYIPAPTIPSALAVLTDLENKLHASFPYNKNGPQRDQYTFSRVRESLLELIDAITQYSHYFVSGNVFPTTTFTYLDQVTYFVHRLPVWDMDQHNQHRLDLYKDMALFWKQAIQTASAQSSPIISTFNADTINLWATHLAHHNTLANGMLGDVILEFNQCFLSTSIPPPACHSSPSSPAWIPSPIIGYTDL